MQNTQEWTESSLQRLIGQQESYQLEFKSARLLTDKNNNDIAEELSQIVSAFANSAGGTIIIGIAEQSTGKRKAKEAASIDGVPVGQVHASTLQQIIASNVSPLLLGVRVKPVILSGVNDGRVAFVIHVPAGTTAYQAHDRLYYGRLEYENRALPDHEIRMRMMRTKLPILELIIGEIRLVEARYVMEQLDEERCQAIEELHIAQKNDRPTYRGLKVRVDELEALMGQEWNFWEHLEFETVLRNSGEITARDFMLLVTTHCDDQIVPPKEGQTLSWFGFEWSSGNKLYPEQQTMFPNDLWRVRVPHDYAAKPSEIILNWKIYLDDAPSVSGELDVGAAWIKATETD